LFLALPDAGPDDCGICDDADSVVDGTTVDPKARTLTGLHTSPTASAIGGLLPKTRGVKPIDPSISVDSERTHLGDRQDDRDNAGAVSFSLPPDKQTIIEPNHSLAA
jgi:hypothetical protein